MKYVYVCLEYSGDVEKHTAYALEVARRINAIPGYMAVVPHNFSRDLADTKTNEEWLRLCVHVMRTCHCIVIDGARSRSDGCMVERNDSQCPEANGIDAFERTFGSKQ